MAEFKCPKCGSEVVLFGHVNCLCDKDFCFGQRCGADKLFSFYECTNEKCKDKGTPPDTLSYMQRHCK